MILVNGNQEMPWSEGLTVKVLLDRMGWDYVLIMVTVNGRFVPTEDHGSTPIPDGADVRAIHIAHGG
jgi:thiamine biosynthesis protein ThiS